MLEIGDRVVLLFDWQEGQHIGARTPDRVEGQVQSVRESGVSFSGAQSVSHLGRRVTHFGIEITRSYRKGCQAGQIVELPADCYRGTWPGPRPALRAPLESHEITVWAPLI